MTKAAVLGAGSWGTALAIQLASNGINVSLWGHNGDHLSTLKQDDENKRYLPGIQFPESLYIETNLQRAIEKSDFILSVVPSYAMRSVCEQLKPLTHSGKFLWASKGFEKQTKLMMHEVVEDVLPTAVTLASNNAQFAQQLAECFHSEHFRVYVSDDVVGVELGGTIKNVLAIASGIVDGLGFGANARAALITRGMAEMMRLGVALNAKPKTLMGLAGMGDLVLTCTDNQSRNRRLGLALATGKTAKQYMDELGQAVEGFHAAQVVNEIAKDKQVDMPICGNVWKVLSGELDLKAAISQLLARDMKQEF